MRAAMAAADVGDDVYGEDPSVRELEERVAALLGKESALFVPSGTMGNQIALLLHTQRGDEVVIGEGAHLNWYESGAGAAWSGVQFAIAGHGGFFDAGELEAAIKPVADYYPRTSLVALENTHNRAGGRIFPRAQVAAVVEVARARGLALHLDGARIWNAAIASSCSESELAAPFDSINVCFSKGLGAPVGSALVASRHAIKAARRFRKMLGGGMRQVGILAAGALYAMNNHRARLVEDHEAARQFVQALSGIENVRVPTPVETNIVHLETASVDAALASRTLAANGVLVNAIGPHALRAVTHLDLSIDDARRAGEITARVLDTLPTSKDEA
jgi:threonine aldolase